MWHVSCLLDGMNTQSSDPSMSHELSVQQWPTRRILLIERTGANFASMQQKLALFDHYQTERISCLESMPALVQASEPDLLILSVDALSNLDFSPLAWLKESNPIPVIVFAQKNSSNTTKSLVEAGISTYIVDDVLPIRLPVIIDFALERFSQIQTVNVELEQTKKKLSERKLIEKAKGLIMRQKNCSEDRAYIEMRKSAMDQGTTIAELSARIISVLDGILD